MSIANAQPGRAQAVRRRGRILGSLASARDKIANRLGSGRCRRVVLLLVSLWLCGVFDLLFTLTAHRIGNFHELNPLAAALLGRPAVLIAFKLAMLAIGSLILFAFRRHTIAEVACWALCGVYAALSVIWLQYYTFLPEVR